MRGKRTYLLIFELAQWRGEIGEVAARRNKMSFALTRRERLATALRGRSCRSGFLSIFV